MAETPPCAPFFRYCPSLHGSSFKVLYPASALRFKDALSWVESQNHSCLSFTAKLTCLCLCCVALGVGYLQPLPSISSLLLPTLLFICLWARHVPEPALITIPHNTVYLPRYQQKGREVRMKGRVGKREKETESWEEEESEREGWEQEERENWFRESKGYETLL